MSGSSVANSSIKNIIFDLGGVLFKWDPHEVLASIFPNSADRLVVLKSVFNTDAWRQFDAGLINEAEAIVLYSQKTGFPEERIRELFDAARNYLVPMPDSVDFMKELKRAGKQVYCLSNANMAFYSNLQKQHPFLSEFDGAVISGALKMSKPDADIYLYLIDKYKLNPEECLFIDDTPCNVETAVQLGMYGVVFISLEDCRKQIAAL